MMSGGLALGLPPHHDLGVQSRMSISHLPHMLSTTLPANKSLQTTSYPYQHLPMAQWSQRFRATTCFTANRLSETTFRIVEDDKFSERPFIYVKIFPSLVMVIDTGCGGAARDPNVHLKSLRQFIERWPVDDNQGQPLNEGGMKPYMVIQTHLHYDHICGMEQFIGSMVVASGYDKSFVTDGLPTRSLCSYLGIQTPKYQITKWAADCDHLHYKQINLRMQILHTPGHTPDSLAVWDDDDKVIFVGDTVYEWTPTIFPSEGDVVDWLGSVDKMIGFVQEKINRMSVPVPVFINCGHVTACGIALEILEEIREFMLNILGRRVPVAQEMMKRGEVHVVYGVQGKDRFVVSAPTRLIREAREQLDL